MAYLEIRQTGPLYGSYVVQGSKNAALPMMAAALLAEGKTVLQHVPRIRDVSVMIRLLEILGCRVTWEGEGLVIDASVVNGSEIPDELMKQMRSSVILLAPILYRRHRASVLQPGGCSIGRRPIDIHLAALEAMGVSLQCRDSEIVASVDQFQGNVINLRFPSVGATQQAVMAAVGAHGTTVLKNAAREPEICELCNLLRKMGADIRGDGTDCIVICGVRQLHGCEYRVCADRIAAATCISAAAICGGRICLEGVRADHLRGVLEAYAGIGCSFWWEKELLWAAREKSLRPMPYLKTAPYPGFATDVQSLLMAVLTQADGSSVLEEGIFEERFHTAYQLQKMNADIIIRNRQARIGKSRLLGAQVWAPDLRGGAALAVAALAAEGVTQITGYEKICRGYEDIAEMFRSLGAAHCRLQESKQNEQVNHGSS